MKFVNILLVFVLVLLGINSWGQSRMDNDISGKVDSVMNLMTLEEKIGQLNLISGEGELTGPVTEDSDYVQQIKKGHLGAMLNVNGSEYTRRIQKIALEETRLGIPLIFGYDVIHGYKTIFPIPLGESATWNPGMLERSARIAAVEATAAGQHWTFAPMVDISRDARWGRIMEGAGEDPYLGSEIAKARVRGFQGGALDESYTMLACAKHYIAYGAARGGRDYNTVDMSIRRMKETHLPPFKAALDAGVATYMTSFNELNGVPVTGSKRFVKGIIKDEWNFNGFIVSDWGSVSEMIVHGFAKDDYEAGRLALDAGVDMDMEGRVYIQELKTLLEDGKISEEQINDAVRRILRMKFELGLFNDPYKYCDEEREEKLLLAEPHRKHARNIASESMVLLKNKGEVLPLSKDLSSVALIGPLVKADQEYLGTWSARGEAEHVVNTMEGFENKLGNNTDMLYSEGCDITGDNRDGFKDALRKARRADAIVAVVGESAMMSGEALSRMDIGLPGVQEELVLELAKLNKPLVVVLMNGRPLAIPKVDEAVPAILEAWLPGTEGGNAIADVVFGDYNPSGKLPASFPYSVGQIPVNYEHKNTGRPKQEDQRYTSKYIDGPNKPLYPFGYGLSYTTFSYSDISLNQEEINFDEVLRLSVTVKNTGDRAGEEVVQMYARDMVGSVTRPVKELKGFRKIFLQPGEEREVIFEIVPDDLAFYTKDMEYKAEPGEFKVFVGSSSEDLKERRFRLVEN
ncbi:MAG: glycoside hydrolase family 3 C-terminal domain-containing protein [Bacteroidales bacterium]|nr:glycoside hydrolase family 3 C-terminal domain-containing protein [Bacteroidales bacterium]